MSTSLMDNPYAKKRKATISDKSSLDFYAAALSPSSDSANAAPPTSANPAVPTSTASAAALVISAADKAGMEGIDRARIDAIILRESGDSLFMQQQRRRDQKVDERIKTLKLKLAAETKNNPDWKHKLEREIDHETPSIIAKRLLRSCCVVVDMDMFYMACELLTRPDLNNRPACVGGNMITTSNYVARRYGVRSAMAGWIGDKLVEELSGGRERLVHVPLNFDLYIAKSAVVRSVLAEYDPGLRAYSLDEVYLDLAPYLAYKLTRGWDHERIREALALADLSQVMDDDDCTRLHDNDDEEGGLLSEYGYEQLLQFPDTQCREAIADIIEEMRLRVTEATGGLTCSAGAAPNFLLAKIASDRNKPNGQLIIGSSHEDIKSFLYCLAPRKVGGIGRVTDKILQSFSITTIAELYEQRALVRLLFRPASASSLMHASIGCSSSDEKASEEDEGGPSQKGISKERTFSAGKSWDDIVARLEDIARLLSSEMTRKGFWARNICVKVKLHTFDCLSRSKTMPTGVYLREKEDIFKCANELLSEMRNNFKGKEFSIRLLGIRCSTLVTDDEKRSSSCGPSIQEFCHSATPARSPSPFSQIKEPTTSGTSAIIKESKQLCMTSFLRNEKPRSRNKTPNATASNLVGVLSSDATMSVEIVYCPLCQKEFLAKENEALNRHIDTCLTVDGESVGTAVKESSVTVTKRRKGSLDRYFLSVHPNQES